MADSTLTLEITKDVNQTSINSHAMSIKAAKALKVFIESLTTIADEFDHEGGEIRLDIGTTIISIKAPADKLEEINKQIADPSIVNTSKPQLQKALKKIHQTISANSIEYKAVIVSPDKTQDVTLEFKDKNRYKPKKEKVRSEYIKFYEGVLKGVVDKRNTKEKRENSFIEIEQTLGTRLHIICTEDQTTVLNDYFKNEIFFSVWQTVNKDTISLKLCDYYSKEEKEQLYSVYQKYLTMEGTDRLKFLYREIERLIYKTEDYSYILKMVNIFNHPDEDISVLRMLLTAIKPIENQEEFLFLKKSIKKKIESRIGKIA